MCVVSLVMDHYKPLFPEPVYPWTAPTTAPVPSVQPNVGQTVYGWPFVDVTELKKLIAEFKEAVEAAKRIDILTQQPDCEDPEKAKLVTRVAELEAQVAMLESQRVPDGYRVIDGKLYVIVPGAPLEVTCLADKTVRPEQAGGLPISLYASQAKYVDITAKT